MLCANSLIFSHMIAKLEGLKRVIWIGMHIDMPEYMSMAQDGYDMISKGEA